MSFIASAFLCFGAPEEADACIRADQQVSVLPIRVEFGPETKIGRKSSGLICAPGGSWYWRDAVIDPATSKRMVSTALVNAGVPVAVHTGDDFDDHRSLADYRLRGRVMSFSIDACTPWKATSGVLGGRRIRGTAAISILWEVYSATEGRVIWQMSQDSELRAGKHIESVDALLLETLSANAQQAGSRWPQGYCEDRRER